MTTLTPKDIIQLLDKEVEWCYTDEGKQVAKDYELDPKFVEGYTTGLTQAKTIIINALFALEE